MQAFHKSEKAKALKKAKAATAKTRVEKLSKRNAFRIQQQIDNLEDLVEAGHARPHDKKVLEDLKKELAAVLKAKKAMGVEERVPVGKRKRGEEGQDGEGKGKAGRNEEEDGDDTDSTDEEALGIPMPPGPLPPLPGQPQPKTTYEAAPVIRDLRKEAATFMPRNMLVQQKKEAPKTQEREDGKPAEKDTGEEGERDEDGGGDEEREEREDVEDVAPASKTPSAERKTEEPPAPPPLLGSMYRINAAPDVDMED